MMGRTHTKQSRAARVRRRLSPFALACALPLFFATSLYGENRAAQHKEPPVYPIAAKTLHIGGVVKVSATVNPAGTVVKAVAQGGNKLLSQAAEDAVKKWRFAPASAETTEAVEVVFKVEE